MRKIPGSVLAAGLVWCLGFGAIAAETVTFPKVIVRWAGAAPTMDGRMDAPCWKDAGMADDFLEYQTKPNLGRDEQGAVRSGLHSSLLFSRMVGPAAVKTEVRLAYDAEALYAFWRIEEPDRAAMDWNMRRLSPSPGDSPDSQLALGDWVRIYCNATPPVPVEVPARFRWEEVCLESLARDQDAFDFLVMPSGLKRAGVAVTGGCALQDYFGKAGINPVWDAIVGRWAKGWTVEMRIPFRDLAELDGTFEAPSPGDTWRMEFLRHRSVNGTSSMWSPHVAGEDVVWRVNNGFGWVTFGPREAGAASLKVRLREPGDFGTLFEVSIFGKGEQVPTLARSVKELAAELGPGAVELTVTNVITPVEARMTIWRDGVADGTPVTANLKTNGVLRLPYRITRGGHYRFDLEASTNGSRIYTCRLQYKAATTDLIERIDGELDETAPMVARNVSRHPGIADLDRRIKEFERRFRPAQAWVANGDVKERSAKLAELKALGKAWQAIWFDAVLVKPYGRGGSGSSSAFLLAAGGSMDKFYRDQPYAGDKVERLSIALAGNEYGSFQLAVYPFWRNVTNLTVTFTDLSGAGGAVIPATNFLWFREEWVKMGSWNGKPIPDREEGYFYEPDILWPGKPFVAPAGQASALWVDLQVPEGTPAGTYRGKVKVTGNGYSAIRDVEVRTYGFDISRKSSLETDWWFMPEFWRPFYGKNYRFDLDIFAKQSAVLGRYRISSFPCHWQSLCPTVPIHREADGKFTFGWTEFDKYVKIALENRSTAFWSALSCNSGWTMWMNDPNRGIIDRASGKILPLSTWYNPTNFNWRTNPAAYKENPLYRDFLAAYVKHLKELGINDISYYELFDEAFIPEMLEHHRFFRDVAPDLRLLNCGYSPTSRIKKEGPEYAKDAYGLVDTWAPFLTEFERHPDMLRESWERRARFGEKLWIYVCAEDYDSAGNYAPFRRKDRPLISLRMHGWFAWKYQLDGYFLYMLCDVDEGNYKDIPLEQRWPNRDWLDHTECWGASGTLIYPGPNGEVIPGMLLANARDGLEDMEYFYVLRSAAASLDPSIHANLLARVKRELDIETGIIESVYKWTKNPADLEAKRDRLAALIKEVYKNYSHVR